MQCKDSKRVNNVRKGRQRDAKSVSSKGKKIREKLKKR